MYLSVIVGFAYHATTDPCQPGRLPDQHPALQRFYQHCVPLSPVQALKLRRVFAAALSLNQFSRLAVRQVLARLVRHIHAFFFRCLRSTDYAKFSVITKNRPLCFL